MVTKLRAHRPRRDRHRRRPALRHRHRRRDRRHRADRLRADLPGAGHRDHGRARAAARWSRSSWSRSAYAGDAAGPRGRGAGPRRARVAAVAPGRVRRRDDVPLRRGRSGPRRATAGGCSCSTACGTPTSTSTTRPTWSSPTSRRSPRSSTARFADGQPLRRYHLGGGGLTFPRYLAETRPGHPQRCVSEIDPGVRRGRRRTARARARDRTSSVRVEDGRTGVAGSPTTAATWSSATRSAASASRGT